MGTYGFIGAFRRAFGGWKMRRQVWPEGDWFEAHTEEDRSMLVRVRSDIDDRQLEWTPGHEDLFALDWVPHTTTLRAEHAQRSS